MVSYSLVLLHFLSYCLSGFSKVEIKSMTNEVVSVQSLWILMSFLFNIVA